VSAEDRQLPGTDEPQVASNPEPEPPSALKLTLTMVIGLVLIGAVILAPAGRIDWIQGWAHIGFLGLGWPVAVVWLRRVNPDVITHRMVIKKGTETWDKVWGAEFALGFPAIYVVAGLDARFEWAQLPLWVCPVGFALLVPGAWLLIRAMGENPFFEKTVRIQTDRGQRVIDTGPYGWVRHPGYTGFLGWILAIPFVLTSGWALIPAALAVISLVVRTALEDRTLQRKLPGYADYAGRVRSRLIPGVW
jgi:protein-S-isoprenylcysteine O-methyltransferase Ste14